MVTKKSQVIQRLRELSNVKNKQPTWISFCSDEQLYELFLRLRNEESSRSIASFVQKAWKLPTGGDVHSLAQGISKFKRRIHDLLQASLVPVETEQKEEKILSRQEEHDDLLALERVIRLQRERIERMLKEERDLGVKHSNLSRDLQSLAALTKVLVKEKEFAIKHAIDPVKEREDEIRARRIDANFETYMSNSTQESRDRMLNVMDIFLQKIVEETIPVTITQDKNGNVQYILDQQNDAKEDRAEKS